MANTFFGFDSTINNEGNLLCDEVDCADNEEDEYDALNDETFGGLEDSTQLDDWERQHEQFAEFAESSKHTEHLENSISQLVLEDSDDVLPTKDYADWSYKLPQKNGDIFNSSLLSSLQKTVSSNESFMDQRHMRKNVNKSSPLPAQPVINNHVPKQICTVEELERGLRQQKQQPVGPSPLLPTNIPPPNHPFLQHQQGLGQVPPRLPPGIRHPMGIPAPGMRPLVPGVPGFFPPNMQAGLPGRMMPPHPALSMMFQNANMQFPMNPFNFPPPLPRTGGPIMNTNMMQMNRPPPPQQQLQHPPQNQQNQQNNRNINNNRMDCMRHKPQDIMEHAPSKDEYAGLMTNREKQWLLNIQQLQLNTGTPYFDDYYYTVFKERKARNNKENQPDRRFHRHRNNERQENTLTPKVYTPLQFENSLGKLQCGSVTAPRKIIDMDVVTLEKDAENTPTRDTLKTKQLLLELEGLYSLILKAEDLRNPLAIANTEKLIELKQKQRIREMDAAQTPEQKQDILRLLTQESAVPTDNQSDYIGKIMSNFLQEDKFTSYLNIRKGKMLLLRVLPHLSAENFGGSHADLWMKVLLSLPAIGRRDTIGDNILPRLHPYFKRYIQTSKMSDILDIVSNITEVARQENNRSTPLSHQGRAPLYFVASNKFGVSALVTMLVRTEYLISSDNVTEKQLNDWSTFILNWAELGVGKCNIAVPTELIPRLVFTKHMNRISKLTEEKKQLLEKYYVDV